MPRLNAINRAQWQPGVYESNPISIPTGLTQCTAIIDRINWPGTNDEVVLEFMVKISFDGGATYEYGWGAGLLGGQQFNFKTGIEDLFNDLIFELPQPDNPNRVGLVTMTVHQRLRTQIDVDVV